MMRGPMDVAEERRAPHGALLAVVLGVVVAGPFLLGDRGEAILGAIPELLGPAGLLFLPLALVLAIRFLSSVNNNFVLSDALLHAGGSPDSFHRVGGSPVGVALLLLLIVALLYYRVSLFGSNGDSE